MQTISRILFFVAGIINLLPSMMAFLPSKIPSSYGVELLNVNYEILLRHRAVLFAVIGSLLIYTSLSKKQMEIAFTAGLVSMVSFIILYFLVGNGVNKELTNVMKIDIAGTVCLILAYITGKYEKRNS
jgi:hypothetical protein